MVNAEPTKDREQDSWPEWPYGDDTSIPAEAIGFSDEEPYCNCESCRR